ncbi:putative Rep protein [Circovirus-like genome CB-A]|uniref:Replication-associated protein n=1 Tax=Circovirus-like genome CB-A TaxID=642256 RepID=C6GII5_9VIRU|nr:putative Rep protein [Circovirus-like genome CB-A]ACQ78166.1 putative Rep protein [Circovirus-like genome CB-A]
MSRSRNWCFTYNNYDSSPRIQKCMKYLTYGYEVGESGTPHLQGFVIFKNAVAKPSQYFKPAYHFEKARGTPQQALEYCQKDGNFKEFGEKPKTVADGGAAGGEANKRRYEEAFSAAKEGRMDDIPADIYIRHYSTLKKIRFDHAPPAQNNDVLNNYWVYGPSGTGKSKSVREFFGKSLYVKNQNKWFDGYEGEDFVLIDDVHPNWSGKTILKIWSDHYPFSPETKGGHIKMIRPEGIIVTSNYTIEEMYEAEEDRQPIRRRFKVIKSEAGYDVIMKEYNKRVAATKICSNTDEDVVVAEHEPCRPATRASAPGDHELPPPATEVQSIVVAVIESPPPPATTDQ